MCPELGVYAVSGLSHIADVTILLQQTDSFNYVIWWDNVLLSSSYFSLFPTDFNNKLSAIFCLLSQDDNVTSVVGDSENLHDNGYAFDS